MLSANNDELRVRAERMQACLADVSLNVGIGAGEAQVGGGTLPRSSVHSLTLDVTHATLKPLELAARLRSQNPPVIGYIGQGRLRLDLRTIFPAQDDDVVRALRAVST
jgi:L-seryl-tRNA(Ser) seleniumtransferase